MQGIKTVAFYRLRIQIMPDLAWVASCCVEQRCESAALTVGRLSWEENDAPAELGGTGLRQLMHVLT